MTTRAMVIVAGGSSTRFGSDKLMVDIEGRPLISHTIEAIQLHVDRVVVACRPELIETISMMHTEITVTSGGATRTLSEMAGLAALGDGTDLVGIHDAARPAVGSDLLDRLFAAAAESGGAVPVLAPDEPLVDRESLKPASGAKRVQTPQVFHGAELVTAYTRAAEAGFEGLDTADVMQRFSSVTIVGVPGDRANLKVTYPTDVDLIRDWIRARSRT